jgi:hypothetical protein
MGHNGISGADARMAEMKQLNDRAMRRIGDE